MKLTAIFLVSIALNVSAKGLAQEKITLSLKDAFLEKVFDQIEVQTGFVFLYKNETIKNKKVSVQVTNASLTQVLDLCLKDLALVYQIVGKSVAIKPVATNSGIDGINEDTSPPLIDVHGRVINEKGDPVAGVTVTIKGSNTSIATDENGEFSLSSVDKQAVLVFTSVNMETFELVVNGKTSLTISLKTKVSALENVQVTASTGYQTIKPNEATGSFSIVDNKMLNQQVGINVLKRLDGMTTSVLFDTKPSAANKRSNITIRGFSSINGPLDPLVVLDGFIYEGNINNINPSIVESITLLKDASAASIWGARAGNGVIVITTKKGNFNQKMQVEVNANVIVSSKPDLFYLPQMSSGDYIDIEQFLYSKGHYNDALNNINRPAVSPAVEIFRKRALNQISAADSADLINSLKANDIRNEYNKHFYRNAVTQQYAMNLRGGTTNSAYIISLGYDRSNSELDNLYKRINVKFENIYRPIKNMQATVGLYYTNSKDLSGKPGYNNVLVGGATVPYLKFADDNGSPLPVASFLREPYSDTAGAGKLLDWKYYPLEDYKHDRTATNLNELFANVGLQYKIFKFLSVDLRYQYQRQQTEKLEIQDIESFATRNRINLFSQLNRSTGIVKYIVPLGGIQTANNSTIESQTYRGQFNFNNSWGMHELVAILGGEVRQTHGSGNKFTTYGYNTDPLSNGIVDFKNSYPTFINNSNQFIPGAPVYSADVFNRFVSLYTNIAYTLQKNYIFSVSARRDGSNIFGVKTNDKWKPLWSAGLGWNISNERFYKLRSISHLKLRATYGFSGNIDLSKSALPVAAYGSSTNINTGFPFGYISVLNDPELRWEKVATTNLGLDFAISDAKLSGSIDYFIKKGSDLYGSTPYDYTAWGYSQTITKNVANMIGRGVEVMLNSKNIDRAFKWSSNLFFTYSYNKVTDYFDPSAQLVSTLLGAGNKITPVVDKPLYAIAAYKWGGLDAAGNPQGFIDGAKSINYVNIANEANLKGVDGNIVYVGSATPTVFGAIINTFTWKNISLAVNVSYKMGYYFRKSVLDYSQLLTGTGHSEYAKRWQKAGDEELTSVPSFIYPDNANRNAFYKLSEVNVLKGDHIRLQYINLSYSLLKDAWKNSPFRDIQVYVNASNLGIIWKANKEGLDPEYPSSLVPIKSFAFGIRTNF